MSCTLKSLGIEARADRGISKAAIQRRGGDVTLANSLLSIEEEFRAQSRIRASELIQYPRRSNDDFTLNIKGDEILCHIFGDVKPPEAE